VPIDVTQPRSEGWWLQRLLKRLDADRSRFNTLDEYYRGENGIPIYADRATRSAINRLMRMSRTNFAELSVEAARERVNPIGFRTGADSDDLGDKEAWRIWQGNALDADFALTVRAAFAMSRAYMIVGLTDPDIGVPLITTEDPRQVIVEHDPAHRRRPLAALKLYWDDVLNADVAWLYLPGRVLKAVRPNTQPDISMEATGFEWETETLLPAKIVPVVEFLNRADAFGRGLGEFEPHLGILDRINYAILNQLETATMQSFRQRAIEGNLPDRDPDTGEDIDWNNIFEQGPGALWRIPPGAKIHELGQADLGPGRLAIRDYVQDFAAVTRTPLHYLTPEAANGSAEGASLAREGLVHRVKDRLGQLGESLEQVMSYAFVMQGDTVRASRPDMEVIWADPERFSLAERYDAAAKAQAAGVPWRSVMSDVLQFSPQAIERMETERAADAFLASVAQPLAAEPQPTVP
jgi:hypothetical protein